MSSFQLSTINADLIKEKALTFGFHLVGIASPDINDQDQAITHLSDWLKQGYHADLAWMNNPKRQNIYELMSDVASVISVALNYYTPQPRPNTSEYGKISRYGWGRDYHKVMTKKLKAFAMWLEAQHPQIKTRYYADTAPIQDKVWAQRAGLGWIAKNSNLITRNYGSWVFLGEIITNLSLTPDQPHTSHCGSCTRCLDACPTQAITKPFVVDANLCIAYHTIENRNPDLPQKIKDNLQGWVAGCDICQDVCPWNERFAQETDVKDFQPYPDNIAPKLTDLATISQEKWDQQFQASALRRIKPEMLRRNAIANFTSLR
jgi:epoxyqueuosine reductase